MSRYYDLLLNHRVFFVAQTWVSFVPMVVVHHCSKCSVQCANSVLQKIILCSISTIYFSFFLFLSRVLGGILGCVVQNLNVHLTRPLPYMHFFSLSLSLTLSLFLSNTLTLFPKCPCCIVLSKHFIMYCKQTLYYQENVRTIEDQLLLDRVFPRC